MCEAGCGAGVCADGEEGWIREGVEEGPVGYRVGAVVTVNKLAASRGVPDDPKTVDIVKNIASFNFIGGFVFVFAIADELGKVVGVDLLG